MRRLLAGLLCLVAVIVVPLPAHAADSPWIGECRPEYPYLECLWWEATVTEVIDGDTVRAKINGDGVGEVTVRLLGINTMEDDDCHARQAKKRLTRLLDDVDMRVRMSAANPPTNGTNGRLLRYLWVRSGTEWQDVGLRLLTEGHALWFSKHTEVYANNVYAFWARRAARLDNNLWDPAYCELGPHQSSTLEIRVQADANGPESDPVSGEMVQVLNHSAVDVPLAGWRVRDSTNSWFTFPKGAVVRASKRLSVGVGPRSPDQANYIWNTGSMTKFADPWSEAFGDGVYLFDKDGDVRAHSIYPSREICRTPGGQIVRSDWKVDAGGRVVGALVHNTSADRTADLDGAYVDGPAGYTYSFWSNSRLGPGETVVIDIVPTPDRTETRLHRFWHAPGYRPSADNVVSVQRFDGSSVLC